MFLAWKELRYHKAKYGLITGILILLLFMVLFLGGLSNGLAGATGSAIRNSKSAYFVISENADEVLTRSELTLSQYNEVKTRGGELAPFNLQRMSLRREDDPTKIDCTYLAVDPAGFMMPEVKGGSGASLGKNEILLDDSFEDDGIKTGDIIKDAATEIEMKVAGYITDTSYGHSSVGVMTLETFQAIRNKITHSGTVKYQGIAIRETFSDIQSINDIAGISVLSKAEIIEKVPGHAQEQMTINMILAVLLVVSAVILGVFLYVITIQRLSQFGTLKAVGTPMKTIAAMVVWQVLLISGCSVVTGGLLTFGLAGIMPARMPFTLSVSEGAVISLAFIAISILSSLFTLIKIAKADPIIAIGGNE